MTATTPSVIQGIVLDDTGRPLGEVAVAIATAPVPVPDIAALTGADGRFVVAAPMPGSYTIVATAPGFGTGRVTVQVDANDAQETNVEIRLSESGN